MWQQRVHTVAAARRRGEDGLSLDDAVARVDEPEQRSWRPFQLAFVLLNLPALADPRHAERTGEHPLVDLLFFPTGGGKTEAYLGLTAFTLAIRGLQGEVEGRSGGDGVAVLMRYTLRLLTLQQFQRAAALICACELLRRRLRGEGDMRWGATPFRIGIWVGARSTPTTTEQADDWAKRAPALQRRGHGRRRLADAARALPVVRNRPQAGPRPARGRQARANAAVLRGPQRAMPVHRPPEPRRGAAGGGRRRGALPPAAGAGHRHRRQVRAHALGRPDPGAVRPRIPTLRAPRLPHPRRGAPRPPPAPGRPSGGERRRRGAPAPARPDHPGRASPHLRPAGQPRRPVRDGDRSPLLVERRRYTSATEGGRLDRHHPPGPHAGRPAVRARGRGLPARGARRARQLLCRAARPARRARRQAGTPLPRGLRPGPAIQERADPRLRGAARRGAASCSRRTRAGRPTRT